MRVIAERAFSDYYILDLVSRTYHQLIHQKEHNMSAWLIALTGCIYLYVAAEQYLVHGNVGMLITYIGYAFANIGLYMLASK